MWNLTVNRLYYACYYAASAILIKDKIEANTHAGVKTQFSRLYILTEKLARTHGTTLSMLFNMRHTGDYDDFFEYDEMTVNKYIPLVETFLSDVNQLCISD